MKEVNSKQISFAKPDDAFERQIDAEKMTLLQRLWWRQLVRIGTVALVLIGMLCFIGAWTCQDHVFKGGYGIFADIMGFFTCLVVLLISVALGSADLIRHCLKRTVPHPAISLTFDFIAFGGLFSLAIIEAIIFPYMYEGEECQAGLDASGCKEGIAQLRALEWTGVSLMFLGSFGHFALFVAACQGVHVRRKEDARRKIEAGRRDSWIQLKEVDDRTGYLSRGDGITVEQE